jgi:hypothetical protein
MMHYVEQVRDTFLSMTPEKVSELGNFKLCARIVRGVAKELGVSRAMAAEIVGSMTINVDTNEYHAFPETFNETVDAMVFAIASMLAAYETELESREAALAIVVAHAKDMSLTYG